MISATQNLSADSQYIPPKKMSGCLQVSLLQAVQPQ